MGRPRKQAPQAGTRFGKWTVLGGNKMEGSEQKILVRCDCGTEGYRNIHNIVRGISTSCGGCRQATLGDAGDRRGEWTILERVSRTHARVRCSCGKEAIRYLYSLGSDSLSCGHEALGTSGGGDRRRWHKLRRVWMGMLSRCENETDLGYANYGGRGIRVCDEWSQDFEAFYVWAKDHGWMLGVAQHIDRIDNAGPYSPDNCRVVTPTENARNKRNTRYVQAWGESKSLAAWVEDPRCRASYATIWARLQRGVAAELAIGTPARVRVA